MTLLDDTLIQGKGLLGFSPPRGFVEGYILCTRASNSTGDLVYASLVKEYCNLAIFVKIQQAQHREPLGEVQ